ncbi:MAG: hypothetical protein QXT91_03150, partial [Candidatus Caldarchaeum sp.]
MTVEAKWVGRRIARRDAYEKASGKTKFASDIVLDDCLWVATLRSKHPHARILNIDVSKAA